MESGAISKVWLLGLTAGLAAGVALSAVSSVFLMYGRIRLRRRRRGGDKLAAETTLLSMGSTDWSFDDDTNQQRDTPSVAAGVEELIGNTPLVRINSLSDITGCEILGKAEFLNPGGSSKDRVALAIIVQAEKEGRISSSRSSRRSSIYSGRADEDLDEAEQCKDTIFEGTVGSTGISLATVARARGYRCHIVMPDDQAKEKYAVLESLGATVEKVRPCSIVDPKHFVNVAKRKAREMNAAAAQDARKDVRVDDYENEESEKDAKRRTRKPRAYFCDQFENEANWMAHFETTGPEILRQTQGRIDAFVMGCGTGGTLAGVARFLKPRVPNLRIILGDPQGSGLFHKVKHGVMYSPTEKEGTRKRHQVDTIVEGIGLNRMTKNFEKLISPDASWPQWRPGSHVGWVDDAVKVTDQEAVEMSRYLMKEDGLFVGSSSSVNCVAAVKIARGLGPGHTIVTILCDSGMRHLTKFWNTEYVDNAGLTPKAKGLEFLE
ncbi:hypothetical protein HK102_002291 [Quaeritorhiza haematococci]|nr:hypothetical protein HK102_002291 [Quaeritorhiza haematococci]